MDLPEIKKKKNILGTFYLFFIKISKKVFNHIDDWFSIVSTAVYGKA